jgi:DNA-binding response OmpR family regulator
MNNTLDVIFLGHDDARHAGLIEALSHLGFNVRRCHDLADVYDRYSRRPCPLVVLKAPLPDIHNAAVRLRAVDRGLGIVAIAAFADAESRIRTLLCGADACLPPDVSGLELAAALQALVRRAVGLDGADAASDGHTPDESVHDTWRLANKGWTLISPTGRTLGLTTGERDFLSRLVNAPDRKVSRDAFYADGADEADSGISRAAQGDGQRDDAADPRRAWLGLHVRSGHHAGPGISGIWGRKPPGGPGRLAPRNGGRERVHLRSGPQRARTKKTRRCLER